RPNVPRVAYLFVWQLVLKQYIETYPEVQTEVVIDSAMVYIVAHGFDAGMRFGGSVRPGMVAVSTGPILDTVVVASPEYLAAHGTPTHPNELSQHHCIGYRFLTFGQMEQWEFEKGDEHLRISTSPRLVLNDVVSIAHAALRGFGIAHLISRYANDWLESGKLVRIAEDWSPQLPRMTLYYRDRRRVPLRLRLLIDLLAKEFSQPRAQ
ncbi:LysR substrate-binding domain-containing protein, partial [Paraburkholderia sediminicola]|uniref:LysR substrate-binding domain-containing protein n=1 Tax=Paraburkholderia sediminicola TaxID=458836 RepID=UPI0038B8585A